MPNIYKFDHDHLAQWGKSPKDLKDLLGGKGANLAEMTSILSLPVPHGFTITTDACRDFLASGWDSNLEVEIMTNITEVERKMGKVFGKPGEGVPLLLSVRSGAKFSMPGMMDTILNLGLNDETVTAFAEANESRRFAYDSYRRFISMFARIVHGVDGRLFDEVIEMRKEATGKEDEKQFTFDDFNTLVNDFKVIYASEVGSEFPQDVNVQLIEAVKAVFDSWNGDRAKTYREVEGIPHDIGTAVNVQSMVFGNRNDQSGTGVAFTRNPNTGEANAYGDFLVKAQGEDVVAGTHKTLSLSSMSGTFASAAQELTDIFKTLEKHYLDMCDVEFTIEDGVLWVLQTRVGKRANPAAVKMAHDMAKSLFQRDWAITKEEAVGRVADILDTFPEKKVVETTVNEEFAPIAKGLAASPGGATGQVVFTADAAVKASAKGTKVILVREETSPDDIHGMQVAEGILTAKGGLVSHAAVVARGWNIPAVVGASEIKIATGFGATKDWFEAGGLKIKAGDTITIDGSTGNIFPGKVKVSAGKDDSVALDTLRAWKAKVNA